MAKMVLKNPFFSIGGTDLSNWVRSVTIDYSADAQDATTSGDGTHINLAGLLNWSMTVEFVQDYAAGAVDATIFPLVGSQTTVEVRPQNAARSATNPGYTGTGLVQSYNPVGGSVGDVVTASVSIAPASTLTRATA